MEKKYLEKINTLLLAVVGFFMMQIYFKFDKQIDVIQTHEVRISVLENKKTAQTDVSPLKFLSYLFIDKIKEPKICGNQ